jgi:hypothetical protein
LPSCLPYALICDTVLSNAKWDYHYFEAKGYLMYLELRTILVDNPPRYFKVLRHGLCVLNVLTGEQDY